MSDDPLLTSLCGICHTREPKYKCPRCGAKTCSLPCVKKHKNWSSCSGERDPTVFIPAAQLRTDRGIDHDYNFLHKLERNIETADKIFTEERGILPQRNESQRPNKRARLGKGQSRGRATLGEGLRPWARSALGRLRKLDINIEHAPYGMSRARENKTSYNQKSRVINWQIEWLLLETGGKPTRILAKAPDTTPLYTAFGECQWHRLSKEQRDAEKKAQKQNPRDDHTLVDDTEEDEVIQGLQNIVSGTWQASVNIMQGFSKGRWDMRINPRLPDPKGSGIQHNKNKYNFFLGNPKDPARVAKKLVPLKATDALETILKGRKVIEFPQIYVLPAGSTPPDDYLVIQAKQELQTSSRKRQNGALVAYDSGSDSEETPDNKPGSKGKREAPRVGDEDESEAEFEFENEEQRAQFLAAYQAQGALDDDTTSSSGSDSSSDEDASNMDID